MRRGRKADWDFRSSVSFALYLQKLMGNNRGDAQTAATIIANLNGFEVYGEMRKRREYPLPPREIREYRVAQLREQVERLLSNKPLESFTPEVQSLILCLQEVVFVVDPY
jgi:hypothetical protein